MRFFTFFLLVSSIAVSAPLACGGTTGSDTTPTVDGGGGDSNASADSSTTTDSGPVVDAASQGCDDLLKSIEARRPKARECCAACRALQCTQTVDDLCCPFSATTVDADFVALVAEHKKRCGPMPCPNVVCNKTPSGQCNPVPGANMMGTCG